VFLRGRHGILEQLEVNCGILFRLISGFRGMAFSKIRSKTLLTAIHDMHRKYVFVVLPFCRQRERIPLVMHGQEGDPC